MKKAKLSLIALLGMTLYGSTFNKSEIDVVEAKEVESLEKNARKTRTWADNYPSVRVVGSSTVGDGAPFCKNIRYGINKQVKGVSFRVKLPEPSDIKLDTWGNHCIYIGYNNGGSKATNAKGIEIGLSHAPAKDIDSNGKKYYSWFYNYDGGGTGLADNGDGRGLKTKTGLDNKNKNASLKAEGDYYLAGSEVLVQLYLDGNKRLNLLINGSLVWTSQTTDNGWSAYTYNTNSSTTNNSKTPGTRIINSVEQNNRFSPWTSSVGKMNFSDIKVFTSQGWESVKEGEATWGIRGLTDSHGKPYGGIEWTIPNPNTFPAENRISTTDEIENYLGRKPTINPYEPLTNFFQTNIS